MICMKCSAAGAHLWPARSRLAGVEFATKQLVIDQDLVKCQVCRMAGRGADLGGAIAYSSWRQLVPALLLWGLPAYPAATCEAVFGSVTPTLWPRRRFGTRQGRSGTAPSQTVRQGRRSARPADCCCAAPLLLRTAVCLSGCLWFSVCCLQAFTSFPREHWRPFSRQSAVLRSLQPTTEAQSVLCLCTM